MTRQLFYIKHPMNFDVNMVVDGFIQRSILSRQTEYEMGKLRDLFLGLLRYIAEPTGNKRGSNEWLTIEGIETDHATEVILTNCGSPLNLDHFRKHFEHFPQVSIEPNSDDRSGQRIKVILPIGLESLEDHIASCHLPEQNNGDFVIRELLPGEEFAVSQLFYQVYRYRYINSRVYDPRNITEDIKNKKLISYVGVTTTGEIVSHVGIVLCNDQPRVYEAAWGIVDPSYGNKGVFRRTFEAALDRMQSLHLSYRLYDFVTNHDFSQRMVAKYGYKDLAIFVGSQVSETQARLSELGVSADAPGMDRYSLLVGVDPREPYPFGSRIALPINLGETCDFLLENLGISWEPANRFQSLPRGGHYTTKHQPEQKSVIFDLHDVGRTAVQDILAELSHHLKHGTEYAAVEFPLGVAGVGYVHDVLGEAGFFMAGLVPYRFSNQLGFRMQFLTPTDLDFSAIKIFSPLGKRLLQIVRDDWERNHLI